MRVNGATVGRAAGRIGIGVAVALLAAAPARGQWAGRWTGAVEFRGDTWEMRLAVPHEGGPATIDLPELLYLGEPVVIAAGADALVVTLPFGLGPVALRAGSNGLTGEAALAGDPLRVRLEPDGPPPRARSIVFESGPARLAGTLRLPDGPGPHPAVVVVHGSAVPGRDRWTYRSWAEWFARRGVAALVWDKRGAGESTGPDWRDADLTELADDVLAAARTLAARPEVDPSRVGAFGGSQAGWLVADAAARSGTIAFVALVSAPGVTPGEQELQSVGGRARAAGLSGEAVAAALAHTRLWLAVAESGEGWDALRRSTARSDSAPWGEYVQRPTRSEDLGWWSRNHDFDPVPRLAALERPALFLYGGADPIVPAGPNAGAVAAATGTDRPGADVTVRVFDRADHRLEVPAGRGPDGRWRFPRLHPDALATLEGWLEWRLGPGPSRRAKPVCGHGRRGAAGGLRCRGSAARKGSSHET